MLLAGRLGQRQADAAVSRPVGLVVAGYPYELEHHAASRVRECGHRSPGRGGGLRIVPPRHDRPGADLLTDRRWRKAQLPVAEVDEALRRRRRARSQWPAGSTPLSATATATVATGDPLGVEQRQLTAAARGVRDVGRHPQHRDPRRGSAPPRRATRTAPGRRR